MTDEEIAELQEENARLRAMTETRGGDGQTPVIVQEAPSAEEATATITAAGEAEVKIIHAQTAQQVAIIEAQSEAQQIEAGAETDESGKVVHDVSPEHKHPYFRQFGKH